MSLARETGGEKLLRCLWNDGGLSGPCSQRYKLRNDPLKYDLEYFFNIEESLSSLNKTDEKFCLRYLLLEEFLLLEL